MSRQITLSLRAMYYMRPDLFDGFRVPSGVVRDNAIKHILNKTDDFEIMYTEPNWFRDKIAEWTNVWFPNWEHLWETTQYDYNPIENYDRREAWTDTRNARQTEKNGNVFSRTSDSDTDYSENNSGYNSNNHSDVAYDTNSLKQTTSDYANNSSMTTGTTKTHESENSENTENRGMDRDDKNDHTGRMHGNIGVTTTQQMIEEERRVAEFNLIDYIADSFCKQFCLLTY